jgi:predicted dienelactone hydrolase
MSASDAVAPGAALTETAPVISVRPVVIPVPERADDLQVRVSAPETGSGLPVIVFSHGFGLSMDAHAPLVDFWASMLLGARVLGADGKPGPDETDARLRPGARRRG